VAPFFVTLRRTGTFNGIYIFCHPFVVTKTKIAPLMLIGIKGAIRKRCTVYLNGRRVGNRLS